MNNIEIDPFEFDFVNRKVQNFFRDELNYIEVPTQAHRSILAACEDPVTVVQYEIGKNVYALPQSGQMSLEYVVCGKKKNMNGVYCNTTSYRNEPNPIPGRHRLTFPLVEWETFGDMDKLREVHTKFLEHMGYDSSKFVHIQYKDALSLYNVNSITHKEEAQMYKDFGPVVFLENFTFDSDPYWNMKADHDKGTARKIDVILSGNETIGSAERSCDVDDMRNRFYSVCGGEYSALLFEKFGKERAESELNDYLSQEFMPRCGAGIGMTRLMSSMKQEGLLNL